MSSPNTPPSTSSSPTGSVSSDDSILELSFDYDYDSDGKLVRIQKGRRKSPQSTPPTPPLSELQAQIASTSTNVQQVQRPSLSDNLHIDLGNLRINQATREVSIPSQSHPSPQHLVPSDPQLGLAPTIHVRRSSLSRSESLPSESLAPARPLQRVISGPVASSTTTPAQPSRSLTSLASGLLGTGRKLGGGPQRIRKEEVERQRRETDERNRREAEEAERERLRRALEEKENHAQNESRYSPPQPGSRQVVSLPMRQSYLGLRPVRSLAINKKSSGIAKINEIENGEGESDDGYQGNQKAASYTAYDQHIPSTTIPPRRGHSEVLVDLKGTVDEALGGYYLNTNNDLPQDIPLPPSRPSSSLSMTGRPRRVTFEEKMRQEQEIAEEERAALEQLSGTDQSPSPTHMAAAHPYGTQARQGRHQRRDSDTLRSAASMYYLNSIQEHEDPQRPVSYIPPEDHVAIAHIAATRHRRSPTAPEAPTTSATLVQQTTQRDNIRTWAAGEVHKDQLHDDRAPVAKQGKAYPVQAVETRVEQPPQTPGNFEPQKNRSMTVNKKSYLRLDLLGKGGSSRVYRVMSSNNEILAIKRVALDKSDSETINGYLNEMALLRRLDGNKRIIKLIDSEVKSGGPNNKGSLMLVMECGEIDLARLLAEQQMEPMNMIWIGYYWQQILQAVQVIHDEKIVHSDLKPANFVLVKGQLKLIDFGIANAIANDTTNIQRDHQIGTVNYMSPEAIELPDGMRRLKVGRPSDVWSLGCILYQMVYGQPPFHHLTVYQKMKAIPDPTFAIEFPEESVPSIPPPKTPPPQGGTPSPPKKLTHLARSVPGYVITTIKKCLIRNSKERAAIPELLDDDWLELREPKPPRPATPPPPPPPPKLALKEDETIINTHYMRQLFHYAVRCARDRDHAMTDQEEMLEAQRLIRELKILASNT